MGGTATDLEAACKPGEGNLVDTLGDTISAKRIRVVLKTIADDEWLAHIKNWRSGPELVQITVDARHPAAANPPISGFGG